MRILLVNKFLYPNGGSETYMFKLGEYLANQGHKVEYFGMEHNKNCVGNSINQYTSNMDFHNARLIQKITYPFKTIYSKEAKKKITKVLENFKPEVLHLNNFSYQLTPSILLAIKEWRKKGNPCRIVFTAHDYKLVCPNNMCNIPSTQENCEKCLGGNYLNCTKNKCIHSSTLKSLIGTLESYYWNNNKVYENIDTIICCSEFMKTKMDTNPIFKDKTIAMHNFIDEVEYAETEKKDYVLYFGRYSTEKGIQTLIEACKELRDVNFIFAGTGPLEEEINRVENIKNVGFKSGEQLKTLISEARFSIYPSEWYENCPFSVMESQQYATPVLGANIGGIPELIKINETGELFESGNKTELISKIQKLWKNKDLCQAYSENCRNINFSSIEQYTSELMKIYEGTI